MLKSQASWLPHIRHAKHYQQLARELSADYSAMREEYPQLRKTIEWLSTQTDDDATRCLWQIIEAIAAYLRADSEHEYLSKLCEQGLSAAERLHRNGAWLWLLKAECSFARGSWALGLTEVQTAIIHGQNVDPPVYARAILTKGKMQLNVGDYQHGVRLLHTARELFTALDDREGEASAVAEIAAYYLNRGENQRALELYEEANRLRGRMELDKLPDHSLLMLGVSYRKLGQTEQALTYLKLLQKRGEAIRLEAIQATAIHHIAWVHLQEGRIADTRQCAEEARKLYQTIDDRRGIADVAEQLGAICLVEGQTGEAERWLRQSILLRRNLGDGNRQRVNRQGIASSLRRLALVFFREGRWLIGSWYLGYSLFLYWRMHMLSKQRLSRLLKGLRIAIIR